MDVAARGDDGTRHVCHLSMVTLREVDLAGGRWALSRSENNLWSVKYHYQLSYCTYRLSRHHITRQVNSSHVASL